MGVVDLSEAKQDVNEAYNYLWDSVKEVIGNLTKPLDDIVKELSKGINLYSNAELWDFQVRLGIESYTLGNLKEQSSLKEACAEAFYKEGVAKSYIDAEGTQESKKQKSILDTIDKQAVSMLWTSVSSLLKTKCDEAHRLVNIIQSIQISRASEAKQIGNARSEANAIDFNPIGNEE